MSSFLLLGTIKCSQVVILLMLLHNCQMLYTFLCMYLKIKSFKSPENLKKVVPFHIWKNLRGFCLLPLFDMKHLLRSPPGALGEPVLGAWVGAGIQDGSAWSLSPGSSSSMWETNLYSAFHLLKCLLIYNLILIYNWSYY